MSEAKKAALFVCNSVYQVLVALWIGYRLYGLENIDYLLTDRMNDGYLIVGRINELTDYSCKAFFAETKTFSRAKGIQPRYSDSHPESTLQQMVTLNSTYQRVYTANIDKFSKLLINAMAQMQIEPPEIILYEDGINTYSRLMEDVYMQSGLSADDHEAIARECNHVMAYPILGNISYALLFCPELLQWKEIRAVGLEKINPHDIYFLTLANEIFNYRQEAGEYDREYIFLEESYYTSGRGIHDIDLLEDIAQIVGKDKIMVKIHPRNPENRFGLLGYKYNRNTSIPWELIIMNNSKILDKTLITIGSSSVFNPKMIFGLKMKVISLINIISKEDSEKLNSLLWELIRYYMELYSDEYKIIESLQELVS